MAQEIPTQSKALARQPGLSRFRLWIADIFITTCVGLAAFPVAKFGAGDSILMMPVTFYSIVVFIVGVREFAEFLIGLDLPSEGLATRLTHIKSLFVVATFLVLMLSAAWVISWLSVSDRIRVVLLLGSVGLMWAFIRRLGRHYLRSSGLTPCGK